MAQATTLTLGAFGALVAIFFKEAAQHALQRRVVTWQLIGYLMAWKQAMIRSEVLFRAYTQVEMRDAALSASYAKGNAHFEEKWREQRKGQEAIRSLLKDGLDKAIAGAALELTDFSRKALQEYASVVAASRSLLTESKGFISDKDAAALGRFPAMHVIRYRMAMLAVSNIIESGVKLAMQEGPERGETLARLLDQLVVSGEDALTSFVRLEAIVQRLSQRSLVSMTIDILRGR